MTAVPLGPGPEFDRVRAIARALGDRAARLGDDCAVLPGGPESICLSVDLSVEGIHFDRRWLEPVEIGWRAAAAALSDLAAVGASVDGVLVGVSASRSDPAELFVDLMRGVGDAVAAVGGQVLGGDLTGGDRLTVSVTVVGRAARPVTRAGARPGDGLWVSGALGGARAALVRWQAGGSPPAAARIRFARPEPRIALGRWLGDRGATAMVDLSDGLAGDARHLAAASGVHLEIDLSLIPVGAGVAEVLGSGEDSAAFAARGGEDYELLVTLPDRFTPENAPAPGLRRIGSVSAGSGARFVRGAHEVELAGFDHFA
jgi:thiamine-monophosphate kinase